MNNKITVRPCKEQPNTWEIVNKNGHVMPKHYSSKQECVNCAKELAEEYSCELNIEDMTE
ncbi:MAG: hypothetical protein ACI35W_06565 [Anaeroplasmataceae bacterium]